MNTFIRKEGSIEAHFSNVMSSDGQEIDFVGQSFTCLYRSNVGVDQYSVYLLLLQCLDSLQGNRNWLAYIVQYAYQLYV